MKSGIGNRGEHESTPAGRSTVIMVGVPGIGLGERSRLALRPFSADLMGTIVDFARERMSVVAGEPIMSRRHAVRAVAAAYAWAVRLNGEAT